MEKNISTNNIREKMEELKQLPGNWNKEKAWEKLQQRQVAKPARRIYYWQYAAAVAIIILAGSVYFIFHKNIEHTIATNNIVVGNFPKENVQKMSLVIWIPAEKKEQLTNKLKVNKKSQRKILQQSLTVINNKNILPPGIANNLAPKDITLANVVIQNSKNITSPKKNLPVVYLNEVEGAPVPEQVADMPVAAQNKAFRFFRTDNNEPFTYASANQHTSPEFFKIKIKN